MRIDVIAKIDISLNNAATARLLDFSSHLARDHRVRMWLQRSDLPPGLKSTAGLDVRLLPAPTPADRPDGVKALRAVIYEAALALRLALAFLRHGRSDAIYLREVATLAPGLVSKLFRVPLFMEIDNFPYRDARQLPGPLQRLRAAVLRWQGRLCAGIVTFSDAQRQVILEDYELPGERVLSIANSADFARFHPVFPGHRHRTAGPRPATRVPGLGGLSPAESGSAGPAERLCRLAGTASIRASRASGAGSRAA